MPGNASIDFVVSEQTILNGRECSKMDVPEGEVSPFSQLFSVPAPYYFYASNDSIFYASDYDPTFRLAYDFSAEAGDSWLFIVPVAGLNEIDTFLVNVDAVGTTFINGQQLRVLNLTYDNIVAVAHTHILQNPISITVTERLGSPVLFFVPWGTIGGDLSVICGIWNIALQCYASPSLTYLNPDFASCVLSSEDSNSKYNLQVYPNPASHTVHVGLPNHPNRIDLVEIYDQQGRMADGYTMTHIADEGFEINVQALRPGLYVIRAWSNGIMHSRKVVVGAK